MKRLNNILWGIVLIAVGVLITLNVLGIGIDIFFAGWWSLFIIVPCFIGLITTREKTGNLIGLGIGVALLLAAQGIFSFSLLWKLIIPFIIIVVGIRLIFKDFFNKRSREVEQKIKAEGGSLRQYAATFSGQSIDYSGEEFTGAELNAVFGSIKLDLRNAVIKGDSVINACGVFGGITVLVPDNINVKISSSSIFGGVSDGRKFKTKDSSVTLYVNGNCIFGGTEIK